MIVSKDLIIKSFDTGFQLSVWLSKGLIIKSEISTIKSINTQKKLDSEPWSVYYESIKRKLKIRCIWVSVWWKTKNKNYGSYTPLIHWVGRGTGTPKDRDEVNNREVCECDGWVCGWDMIGDPSMFRLIRKAAVLARIFPHFDFSIEENAARRKWDPLIVYYESMKRKLI